MNVKILTIVSLIVIVAISVSILYPRFKGQGSVNLVNWLSDYDVGVAKAKSENKLVMVDFYADWCSWCKVLDEETYSNGEVASYVNEKFICVKIDADKSLSLAQNYNVTGLPTILFLSNSGKEVGRILGYQPPTQFLTNAKNIASKYN